MNRYNFKDIEKILKSCLKYRYKLSKASLIAFLICGLFSYGATKVIETNGEGDKATIGPKGEKIGEGSVILAVGTRSGVKGRKFVENGDLTQRIKQGGFGQGSDGFITIHGSNGLGEDYKYVKESVIIGNRATHINISKGQVVTGIVAIGEKAAAYIDAVAVGRDSVASKEGSIALGSESYAGNKDNIALGRLAFTQNGDGIITIGAYSAALSKHSTSLGYGAIIETGADGSLALGKEARVKTKSKDAIALGSYSIANRDVVEIKKDDGKDNKNRTYISEEMENKYKDKLLGAVSIGSNENNKEKYRQIVNLAPGTKEHDAVNLGQLREALKNASSSFIINTDNNEKTNEITKEFTIKGKTTNVGSNSNGNIITSVTNSKDSKNVVEIALNKNLKGIETIGKDESLKISFEDKNSTKKIQITVDDKSLNVLKETNGIKISGVSEIENDRDNLIKFSKGTQGDISSVIKVGGVDLLLKKGNSSITISNVALGDITDNSTEAINGKQFYQLSNNILGLKVENKISKLNWTSDKKIKWNSDQEEKLENKNYKEVIEKLVDTINLGIKFKDGVNETKAFLLGSTISIKAGNFEDKAVQTTTKFLSDNIRTKVSKDGLLIGIKENPSFKALTIRDNVTDLIQLGGSKGQGGTLIIKDGISNDASVEIKAKEKTIKLGEMQLNGKDNKIEGLDKIESSNKVNKIDLNKNGTKDIEITVQDKNITISKDNQNDGVKINGISQLGKNENNNISFNSKNTTNSSLDIKIDGQNLTLTKDNENKIKISNVATPKDNYDAVNKKYVDDEILGTKKLVDEVIDEVVNNRTDINKIKGAIYTKVDKEDFDNHKKEVEDKLNTKLDESKFNEYKKSSEKIIKSNTEKISKNEKSIKELQENGIKFKGDKNESELVKLGETFEIKGDSETVETSVNGKGLTIKLNEKFKESLALKNDLEIKYKVTNDENDLNNTKKQVKLSEGFNFKGDKNIELEAKDNGKINFALKNNLTGINSIENNKTKIELKDSEGVKIISDNKFINIKGEEISSVSKIGKDDNNGIIFNKVDGENVKSVIKIGGSELILTKSNDKVRISNLESPLLEEDATNKKYVDENLKILKDSNPFEYTIDNKPVLVIKEKDGLKYYFEEDLENGKPRKDKKQIESDQVKKLIVRQKGEEKELTNIKSALGINKESKDLSTSISNLLSKNIDENEYKDKINSAVTLLDLRALGLSGLNFSGNTGKINKKIGENLTIKGIDSNINVKVENEEMLIELSKNLQNLETAKFSKNGNNLSIDSEQINFEENKGRIKGLKDIADSETDGSVAANKNYVDSKFKEVKQTSNGAIAGAIAMANLPQVSGNSIANVSAALGYQDKSVALALGISGTNKKGNVVYKASGSINTQANVSLGAGLGYQFGVNRSKELVDINSIKKVVNKHTLKIKQLEDKNKVLEKEVKINRENYNNLKENYNKINEKNNILEKELKEIKEILKKVVNK